MTDQMLVGISIISTIILYPFYFIAMSKLRAHANQNSRDVKAMREGKSVIARVVKVARHHGAPFSSTPGDEYKVYYTVTYEYIVNDKKYRKTYIDEYGDAKEEIMMYYFPKNPKRAYSEGNAIDSAKKKVGCLTALIIPAIFMLLLAKILMILF